MSFKDLKEARKSAPTNRFQALAGQAPVIQTRNLRQPEIPAPAPVNEAEDAEDAAGQGGEPDVAASAGPAPAPTDRTAAARATEAQISASGRPVPAPAAAKVDGRSLRATGRTEQLNVKVRPESKARFLQAVQMLKNSSGGKTGGEYMEEWIDELWKRANKGG